MAKLRLRSVARPSTLTDGRKKNRKRKRKLSCSLLPQKFPPNFAFGRQSQSCKLADKLSFAGAAAPLCFHSAETPLIQRQAETIPSAASGAPEVLAHKLPAGPTGSRSLLHSQPGELKMKRRKEESRVCRELSSDWTRCKLMLNSLPFFFPQLFKRCENIAAVLKGLLQVCFLVNGAASR